MAVPQAKTDRCMYKQADFDYVGFGSECRKQRKYNEYTQDYIAQQVGVVRSTIYMLEHGRATNIRTMMAVAKILNVDLMKYNTIDV
jgi:DNA-binding XRE family transcriptional regulator